MGHWGITLAILMACGILLSLADIIPVQPDRNDVKLPEPEPFDTSTRPPYYDKARRARYIVHKADWALLASISTKPEILGRAFPAAASVSDGPHGNSSGTPYFYLAAIDSVMHDIVKNPNVTLSFSEAEFSDVQDCVISDSSDPESPLCARLMVFGKLVHVTDTAELAFAKDALFSRHPLMPSWPSSHDFMFIKLAIEDIWILDYYGGGSLLSVQDYYNAEP